MSSVGGNGTADKVPPDELVQLVQRNWPWSEWSNALAISLNESDWSPDAEYKSVDQDHPCGSVVGQRNGEVLTAEWSVSYFQVNLCNYPPERWDELRTPEGNVAEAARLWRDRAWQPWFFSAQYLGLM